MTKETMKKVMDMRGILSDSSKGHGQCKTFTHASLKSSKRNDGTWASTCVSTFGTYLFSIVAPTELILMDKLFAVYGRLRKHEADIKEFVWDSIDWGEHLDLGYKYRDFYDEDSQPFSIFLTHLNGYYELSWNYTIWNDSIEDYETLSEGVQNASTKAEALDSFCSILEQLNKRPFQFKFPYRPDRKLGAYIGEFIYGI